MALPSNGARLRCNWRSQCMPLRQLTEEILPVKTRAQVARLIVLSPLPRSSRLTVACEKASPRSAPHGRNFASQQDHHENTATMRQSGLTKHVGLPLSPEAQRCNKFLVSQLAKFLPCRADQLLSSLSLRVILELQGGGGCHHLHV